MWPFSRHTKSSGILASIKEDISLRERRWARMQRMGVLFIHDPDLLHWYCPICKRWYQMSDQRHVGFCFGKRMAIGTQIHKMGPRPYVKRALEIWDMVREEVQ